MISRTLTSHGAITPLYSNEYLPNTPASPHRKPPVIVSAVPLTISFRSSLSESCSLDTLLPNLSLPILIFDHHFNDFFIRLTHTFFSETSDISQCRLYTFCHDSIPAIKFLTTDIHIISKDSGIYCRCNLCRTGCFRAIADDT